MKNIVNVMKLEVRAESINESFARTTVAAFASQFDPTLEEISDMKTAVSEAVTNSVVHSQTQTILIECELWQDVDMRGINIKITDFGMGIVNIEKALEPFYTSKPEQERSGMGFTVMQSFMDSLEVKNGMDCGTIVSMTKLFAVETKKVG